MHTSTCACAHHSTTHHSNVSINRCATHTSCACFLETKKTSSVFLTSAQCDPWFDEMEFVGRSNDMLAKELLDAFHIKRCGLDLSYICFSVHAMSYVAVKGA